MQHRCADKKQSARRTCAQIIAEIEKLKIDVHALQIATHSKAFATKDCETAVAALRRIDTQIKVNQHYKAKQ